MGAAYLRGSGGMIGPNWSYGWIVEDNVLHDAPNSPRCHWAKKSLIRRQRVGENRAQDRLPVPVGGRVQGPPHRLGKGAVGGHIVRNNDIWCGQNAIVGHMGSAFCRIEHNHVHHIALKREFFGWEVAGIKFHAALDTVIANNNIHDCSLGMDGLATRRTFTSRAMCSTITSVTS